MREVEEVDFKVKCRTRAVKKLTHAASSVMYLSSAV